VTTFYFYERLTLREIGGSLNLTEGRISQILHQALASLRETLSEGPQFSDPNRSPRGRLLSYLEA
jgi:RNA polymerase sigma factor FliA